MLMENLENLQVPKLIPDPKQLKYPIGSIRNGLKCIPKKERKKILVLGDDLRMYSGIATMTREFVAGLCHHFNFVQLGAAIKHPDKGKIFDLSQSIVDELGVEDPEVKVYPNDGYGDPPTLRNLINIEKPDAILHFTDPRYWEWLYQMEHELRQFIPIFYYNIWDCTPDPEYNTLFYQSCDLLMAISKQTYGINKRLLPFYKDWQIKYVPHGINSDSFFPLEEDDPELLAYSEKSFQGKKPKFIVGFNSRNIRRKCISDLIHAYKLFTDTLPEEELDQVGLLLHTQRSDPNGTNLVEVIKALKVKGPVYFSENKITTQELNWFYNQCDVVVNISSNEGFGLSIAESLMAGTPVIVNVTGGLQDQVGFKKEDGTYFTAEDYIEIKTLHDKDIWEGRVRPGEWAIPVWPASINLVGSLPTPYIFDTLPDVKGVAKAIETYYRMSPEERKERGLKGRKALIEDLDMSSEGMCTRMGQAMVEAFKNWQPRERFTLYTI